MRQYPIWMDVSACIYQSSKSYGVKKDGVTKVLVGHSSSNSHHFAEVTVTCREAEVGRSRTFRLYVDGKMVKEATVKNGEIKFNVDRVKKMKPLKKKEDK